MEANSKITTEKDSFYYLQRVFSKDGVVGCFRGLHFRLCEILIICTLTDVVWKLFSARRSPLEEEGTGDWLPELSYHSISVVLTQPFHNMLVQSFWGFLLQQNDSAHQIVALIYQQFGFYGFFMGMSTRLCGEAVLRSAIMSVNKLLRIRRRTPHTFKEMALMTVRDAAARRLSWPLQVLSYSHATPRAICTPASK